MIPHFCSSLIPSNQCRIVCSLVHTRRPPRSSKSTWVTSLAQVQPLSAMSLSQLPSFSLIQAANCLVYRIVVFPALGGFVPQLTLHLLVPLEPNSRCLHICNLTHLLPIRSQLRPGAPAATVHARRNKEREREREEHSPDPEIRGKTRSLTALSLK